MTKAMCEMIINKAEAFTDIKDSVYTDYKTINKTPNEDSYEYYYNYAADCIFYFVRYVVKDWSVLIGEYFDDNDIEDMIKVLKERRLNNEKR